MDLLKRLGFRFSVFIFSVLLVPLALFASVFMVFDKPDNLKSALDTSGLYAIVTKGVGEHLQKSAQNTPSAESAVLQHPEVKEAVEEAFSPAFVKETSEKNIDSIYAWIHGTTNAPKLSVDLSKPKSDFAKSMGELALQRMQALPACTAAVPIPTTIEAAMALSCKPKGVPPELVALGAEQLALQSPVIEQKTPESLSLKDEQGQALTDKFEVVPRVYHYFVLLLFIMPGLLLLGAVGMITLGATKRSSLRSIGRTLLVTGILTIIFSIIATLTLDHLLKDAIQKGLAADVQSAVLRFVTSLVGDLRVWWMALGGIYTLLGAGLLAFLHFTKKKGVERVQNFDKTIGYPGRARSMEIIETDSTKIKTRP